MQGIDITYVVNIALVVVAVAVIVKLLLEKRWKLADTCAVLQDVIARLEKSPDAEDKLLAQRIRMIAGFVCGKYWKKRAQRGMVYIALIAGLFLIALSAAFLFLSMNRPLHSLEYQLVSTALTLGAMLIAYGVLY